MPARHLDAAQLLLFELALTMFPVAFPQLTRLVAGAGPEDSEFTERRRALLESLGRLLSTSEAMAELRPATLTSDG